MPSSLEGRVGEGMYALNPKYRTRVRENWDLVHGFKGQRRMASHPRPRVYQREFKLTLMRQWEAGEKTCAQLVREHNIAQSVLYRWHDAYRRHGEYAFTEESLSQEQTQEHRIAELERALGQATLENQILKKGLRLAQSQSGTP
jgi:transposase